MKTAQKVSEAQRQPEPAAHAVPSVQDAPGGRLPTGEKMLTSAAADAPPARAAGSLRWRLLGASLLITWLTIALAGWGLRALFVDHIHQQLQDQLIIELDHLSARLEWSTAQAALLPLAPDDHDPRLRRPLSGLYWQIDRLGERPQQAIARSRSLWDQQLATAPPATIASVAASAVPAAGSGIRRWQLPGPQGQPLLVVQRRLQLPEAGAPALRLSVAGDERLLAEPLQRFTRLLLLALALLAVGLSVLVVVQLQLALRPLQALQRRLIRVRDGETSELQGRFPEELMPLVSAFNHVLRQNHDMVERARTQAGNLAHALRTPLSILANAASSGVERAELAALVSEQTALASRQVDYQLARARAATAVRATGLRTPLAPVLQALMRTMQRLHGTRGIAFELVLPPALEGLAFRGEADDLFELVGNLLDNAGKWARTRVRLSLAWQAPGELCLSVEDDGPGIAPAARAALFARGVRLDQQRPGAGLGLDIVRTLAETYGGRVTVAEAALGGACFRLFLPALA